MDEGRERGAEEASRAKAKGWERKASGAKAESGPEGLAIVAGLAAAEVDPTAGVQVEHTRLVVGRARLRRAPSALQHLHGRRR